MDTSTIKKLKTPLTRHLGYNQNPSKRLLTSGGVEKIFKRAFSTTNLDKIKKILKQAGIKHNKLLNTPAPIKEKLVIDVLKILDKTGSLKNSYNTTLGRVKRDQYKEHTSLVRKERQRVIGLSRKEQYELLENKKLQKNLNPGAEQGLRDIKARRGREIKRSKRIEQAEKRISEAAGQQKVSRQKQSTKQEKQKVSAERIARDKTSSQDNSIKEKDFDKKPTSLNTGVGTPHTGDVISFEAELAKQQETTGSPVTTLQGKIDKTAANLSQRTQEVDSNLAGSELNATPEGHKDTELAFNNKEGGSDIVSEDVKPKPIVGFIDPTTKEVQIDNNVVSLAAHKASKNLSGADKKEEEQKAA